MLDQNCEADYHCLQHYWHKVFLPEWPAWDSSMPIQKPDISMSVPRPRDLRVPVGEWNQDLPPSTCAKRHENDRKTELKAKRGRRKGERAFVQARYKEDSKHQFVFLYCDENGKGADSKHIDFSGIDSARTAESRHLNHSLQKSRALLSADRSAAVCAEEFNTDYLVYLMRCRLMRILSDTVPAKLISQRHPNPTAVDLKTFVRPTSIESLLMVRPSTGGRALMQQFIRYSKARRDLFHNPASQVFTLPDDFWDV